MIVITDKSHPKQQLAKALIERGFSDFTLYYYPRWSSTCGWHCEIQDKDLNNWLGFTKGEAIMKIDEILDKRLPRAHRE